MFARTRRGVIAADEYRHGHGQEHRHHHHSHEHEHEHEHDHDGHQHHSVGEYADEHEKEHSAGIHERFANRPVTTGQLILFGLTGGLLPCPAAFAVLLVCLQLKQFTLGFTLVVAFSLGLATTLVTVGSVAALSVRHASKRFHGFGEFARKLPYVSSAVMLLIGVLLSGQGIHSLLR
jgi:nickel/cobalt transporter (NicO) family protein